MFKSKADYLDEMIRDNSSRKRNDVYHEFEFMKGHKGATKW